MDIISISTGDVRRILTRLAGLIGGNGFPRISLEYGFYPGPEFPEEIPTGTLRASISTWDKGVWQEVQSFIIPLDGICIDDLLAGFTLYLKMRRRYHGGTFNGYWEETDVERLRSICEMARVYTRNEEIISRLINEQTGPDSPIWVEIDKLQDENHELYVTVIGEHRFEALLQDG